jgi:hypothetical protein
LFFSAPVAVNLSRANLNLSRVNLMNVHPGYVSLTEYRAALTAGLYQSFTMASKLAIVKSVNRKDFWSFLRRGA